MRDSSIWLLCTAFYAIIKLSFLYVLSQEFGEFYANQCKDKRRRLELSGDLLFAWGTGHLAAGLDPLSAARYSGTLVCVCQHWRSGGPHGQRFYADIEPLHDICLERCC